MVQPSIPSIGTERSQIDAALFAGGVAVALGILVRLLPALPGPLTNGDGGFVVSMVEDIRRASLAYPEVASYNSLGIPFLYPPVALVIGASLATVTGADSLAVVRLLSFTWSVATLLLFALVARRLLSPIAAVGAMFMFALMPSAFANVVAGGGLTRGLGLLLVLLVMYVASGPLPLGIRATVALGVALGLSVMTHPQVWPFALAAAGVLLYRPTSPRVYAKTLVGGLSISALVAAPWLMFISGRYGIDALLSIGHRWEPAKDALQSLALGFSESPWADIFLAAGVVGLVVAVGRAQYALPAMLGIGTLIGIYGAPYLGATIWALLGGSGIAFVAGVFEHVWPSRRAIALGVAGAALLLALLGSRNSIASENSHLHRVSDQQAEAMRWVAGNTSANTRFVVATTSLWGDDEISEWFPAIADRQSVGTVQGSEWLGSAGFAGQLDRHRAIYECTRTTSHCLAEWTSSSGLDGAWIFIPKGQTNGPRSPEECCPALRETVQSGVLYEVVYDGPGATIAKPVSP